jgi:hypothetical protein
MQKLAFALLGVTVVAEGAYLAKLDREVGRLSHRLNDAAGAGSTNPAPEAPGIGRPAPTREPARAPLATRPPGLPIFAATAPNPPVLDTLGSPQGRQKLQELLASFKEERRREKLLQSTEKRARTGQTLKATIGAELGLDADEARKSEQLLDRLEAQRRQLMDELQSGTKSRADAKKELDAAGRAADASLQEIIGEKRMTAFRELRRRIDRGGDGPASAGPPPAR